MTTPFNLTDDDIQSSAQNDDDVDGGIEDEELAKIPILKRRADAAKAKATASATDGASTSSAASKKRGNDDPVCVIVVGMAGSGKTTLMAQLQKSLSLKARENEVKGLEKLNIGGGEADGKAEEDEANGKDSSSETTPAPSRAGYAINLDPAAKYVPFSSSIDIRDTVDYVEVMRQHKLGPNGAILTCLNLFATKFDQVMGILEERAFGSGESSAGSDDAKKSEEGGEKAEEEPKAESQDNDTAKSPLDYILIDTPGQIEAFTWSASGSIVTAALATTFPTVLAFVIDTPRCAASVHTFMSNMLYACSMLYRAKLPMVIVLNKTDVVGCEFIKEWMEDYDSFQEALDDASASGNGHSDEMAGGSGYYSSLTRSLSLVLDEFYNHLHKVGVSAATGDGVDEFWEVVQNAAADYEEGYLEDLKLRIEEQKAKERAMQRASARAGVRRLARDLEADGKL